MKVVILQFPGTNCEYDTQHAFEKLGATTEIIWHKSESIPSDTNLLVVAGGFSYGDYLRSGAIARFSPVMKAVIEYANNGGKVLGICNGFQFFTLHRRVKNDFSKTGRQRFDKGFEIFRRQEFSEIFYCG